MGENCRNVTKTTEIYLEKAKEKVQKHALVKGSETRQEKKKTITVTDR